jgi:hypothetical protein
MGFQSMFDELEQRIKTDKQKFGYEHKGELEDLIRNGLGQTQTSTAPQINPTQQNQFRDGQLQQMNQLGAIASGQQAGPGQLAVDQQIRNALASQYATARMRGAGGMGLRTAARQGAAIGLSGAGMAQQAQMQDSQQAGALMAGIAQQGRAQDIGLGAQNAQLTQQQQQMNNQQYLQLLSQLGLMDANQLQAYTQMRIAQMGQPNKTGQYLMAGGQVLGGLAMLSDETKKTDIAEAGDLTDQMLDALKPYRYRYKDEKFGQGERAGIMAQDLERSELGKKVVTETAEGKMLDVNKTISAALAGLARVNERLRKVEGRG